VHIEYDPIKDLVNQAKHGVSLEAAARAAWDEAVIFPDLRWDYGEMREMALVPVEDTLHAIVFTARAGSLRIISLRRANRRERRLYHARRDEEDQTGRSERGR
jgi:uncharacterized DUF497 family protein